MASDRIVTTAFWNNDDVQGLNGYERAIYLHLITAPGSALCGLYETTLSDIAHYTGWSIKRVETSLATLSEKGKIVYDGGVMFVRKLSDGQHAQKFGGFKHHVHKVSRDLKKPKNKAYEAFSEKFRTLLEGFENPSPEVHEVHIKVKQKEPFSNPSRRVKEKEKENTNVKSLEEGSGEKPLPTPDEVKEITSEIKKNLRRGKGVEPIENVLESTLDSIIPQ